MRFVHFICYTNMSLLVYQSVQMLIAGSISKFMWYEREMFLLSMLGFL